MSHEQVAATRGRMSYRLLVLSWRVIFVSIAVIASTQVLKAHHLISHGVSVGIVAPLVAVFVVSVLTAIVTMAIQAAHFSVSPLGRGILERQMRFSRMFLVDLVTLPWNPSARRK
ncbi:hypothetical protein O7614_11795 [Micromonospora sp. WMMD961]|uniref:hypothetical protein n=1 Tax=Micromonospora sp. WMMD961 TaxID=3016100 RepID=UPI0024162ADE|nr:hypothetical protein [Micromonospora sp. WMMD961]MDG4780324.1 hypothetical protein [Micromonospora sp. WMMD961]